MTSAQLDTTTNTKHPKGLMMLFFTEMWERFAYYGMRALLMLYMTKAFLFSDSKAYMIYGAFTAFVYVTPIIGGILADRYLGFRQSTSIGTITMAIGYICLAFSDARTDVAEFLFLSSLAIIIIGNGLFKPSTSSLVGLLYPPGDDRRDAGYTIFYMGINTGSILAPILCGFIGEMYGWSYGFLLTAFGLLCGLVTFVAYEQSLGNVGLPSGKRIASSLGVGAFSNTAACISLMLLSVPIIIFLIYSQLSAYLLIVAGVLTLQFIWWQTRHMSRLEKRRMTGLLIMMFFYACFFAFFEQSGSSLNLFTDRYVDRHFIFLSTGLDFIVPATLFQAVNPIFIILFAPLVAGLWQVAQKYNLEPSTPGKFVLGFLLTAIGFLLFGISGHYVSTDMHVSVIWLVLGNFFLTLGELTISPVGMAMISRYTPEKYLGLMMGSLLLSIAYGNYIAALFAKLSSQSTDIIGHNIDELHHFTQAFIQLAGYATVVALFLLLLMPLIKQLFELEEKTMTKDWVALVEKD